MRDPVFPPPPPAANSRHAQPPRRVLARFLGILRAHKWAALLAFLAVFSWIALRTLYQTPSYVATATVRVLDAEQSGRLIEELADLEGTSTLSTEMEIMRSRRVARLAARSYLGYPPRLEVYRAWVQDSMAQITGDAGARGEGKEDTRPRVGLEPPAAWSEPPAEVRARAQEEHAYRPLDVLLRSTGRGRAPLDIRCHVAVPASGEIEPRTFRLVFDRKTPLGVTVHHKGEQERASGVAFNEPWEAFGERFRLQPAGADAQGTTATELAGRTYIVHVIDEAIATRLIRRAAKISPVGMYTGIVALGCHAPTGREAADLANALAEAYLLHQWEERWATLKTGGLWIWERQRQLRRSVQSARDALNAYLADHADSANPTQLVASNLDMQGQVRERTRDLRAVLRNLDWMHAHVSAVPPKDHDRLLVVLRAYGIDATSTQLATRLEELRQEQRKAEEGMRSPDHPDIKAIQAQIDFVTKRLGTSLTRLRDEFLVKNRAEHEQRHQELEIAEADLKELRLRVDEFPRIEREMQELRRKIVEPMAELQRVGDRALEFRMATSKMRDRAVLVDEATPAILRASPQLLNKAIVGCVLGLAVAIALALLLDLLDRRIRGPGELEDALGIPVLANVPEVDTMRRRERLPRGATLATLARPRGLLAEEYRGLRVNLRFGTNQDEPIRTLAITSAAQGEGKTITTLNLAVAMADAGDKVLVIDADLRRPTVHQHLDVKRTPGVSTHLADPAGDRAWREHIQEGPVAGLDVLSAGDAVADPIASLDTPAFRGLIAEAKEQYDQVLIDVPPALAVADTGAFLHRLDAVLLLVRHGKATTEMAQDAARRIRRLGGRLIGFVFNGFDARRSEGYGYHYGYGYGHSTTAKHKE